MGAGKLVLVLLSCLLVGSWAVEYRLSQNVLPDSYDIHIKPYLHAKDGSKQFTFEGEVSITLHAAVDNLKEITLHKNLIDILEVTFLDTTDNSKEQISNESLAYEVETDKLTISLSKSMVLNRKYVLYFKYSGVIRNSTEGFYGASYDNVNWYGITQLHRIDARTVFPCFDEPALKAKFRMHINRINAYKSFFNTRLEKTTSDGTDRSIDHFEETPIMSTYLVAFVISDFESTGSEDLKIIMHSKLLNKTNFAYEVGLRALEGYDKYTKLPYKSLGNSIMQFLGSNHFPHYGMENWGLVIYKDSGLAHEPGYTDGFINKQFTISDVVHETAHMWFGNSVTHKWWSYFWLNEGFARFYQYFMGHELYPEYEFDKQFIDDQLHMIFELDATNGTQPLTSPEKSVNTPSEIGEKFSKIAYNKGACVIRMFKNLMGKNNFDAAIRGYLKENHLKSPEPEDLFKHLKQHWPNHDVNLTEFFSTWTEQVGYPMVNVTASGNMYRLSQQRFLLNSSDGSDRDIKYNIPITCTYSTTANFSNLTPTFYMSKSTILIAFGNVTYHKWMMVNTQQSNYYRVFYDDFLLERLRNAFKSNHLVFHVNNRAGMIDDLFAFARADYRRYEDVFKFMDYLENELDYLPWQTAFKVYDFIYPRLTSVQHNIFGQYLQEILKKIYQKLDFGNPNVTILDVFNRNNVINWLCRYHHKDCNKIAQLIFRSHLVANTKPSPDFRESVYCAAVREDVTDIYDSLKQMFLKQDLLTEKEKILRAMGCTQYRVKDHYDFVLSQNVQFDLKETGLKSLYSQTPENINTVFNLMIGNIEKLSESLDWLRAANIITDISNYLTTQEQFDLLKQFIQDKGLLFGEHKLIVETSLQTVENNFKWSAKHMREIVTHFNAYKIKYRLTKDVIPDSYDIHIKPYLQQKDGSQKYTFDGEVNITLHATEENVKKITVHKDYMQILEVILIDKNGQVVENINDENIFYDYSSDKYTMYLQTSLEVNTAYTLYFKYKGQIRNGMAGLFRATYDNVNWYGITQLQRIDARTAFPCFDEPEFKAKFRMHISRPNEYNSVFNTRLLETTSDGTDRSIDHFEETPLMSTYLVAFMISDFESQGTDDFKLIMHSKFRNKTDFTYEVALKTLKAYDDYTQLPYKTLGNTLMQKAGSIKFPHNGMENWGLVMYKDSVLAHEPNYTDGWSNKEYTITILAHETSHMWFGNSVTFKWWSYFWLNEAFARYYQYFMAHELYPEYELDKQFVVNQLQMIFDTDASNGTQPLTSPEDSINTPSEVGYKFSGITYAKGAAIVRMFANLMGKERFDQAIREYLRENHLKNTVPQDLFKYLKKYWPQEHQVNLDVFFKDWTEQVGYPMISVTAKPNGRFGLTQKRFLLDPLDGSDTKIRYTIPITLNSAKRNNFTDLTPAFYFNKTQGEITFANSSSQAWIIVNTQQSNYFRVFYSSELQKRLSVVFKAANHSDIHVSNRASVVDDLFTFGRSGLKEYDDVFTFMEYLSTETEYTPWYAAFKGLNFVSMRLVVEKQPDLGKFLFRILDKVYKLLGFENSNDTVLDVYNRNKVISWLCRYHHEECNKKAKEIFQSHWSSNSQPSPDFRETLYCAAGRNDKSDVQEKLNKLYENTNLMSEKEKLLRAMGCTRYNINDQYSFILTDKVPQGLKSLAFTALYSQTPENVMPVFKLFIDRIDRLAMALQGWSSVAEIFSDISNHLTTKEQLDMLKKLTEDRRQYFGTSVGVLEDSIKRTESNLQWADKRLGKLYNYLAPGNNSAGSASASILIIAIGLMALQWFV